PGSPPSSPLNTRVDKLQTFNSNPFPMSTPTEGLHAEYHRRLADLRTAEARWQRQLAWYGNARFLLLLSLPASLAVVDWFLAISPLWLALPIGGFMVLSVGFARVARQLAAARSAAAYFD